MKPEVIIETGVAHGGSLVLYASLLKAMAVPGRVIGIDILIRPPNRKALEAHALAPMITLIQGDSVADSTVAKVKSSIRPAEKVLVILDSCHTKEHVTKELSAYCELVTPGSYIVATVARYYDQLVRRDGQWLFARRQIRMAGEPLPDGARPSPTR